MSETIVPWVGIDLDGTLAEYTVWQGIQHIGKPIELTLRYVQFLRKHGVEVKIFTARCQEGPVAINRIMEWCQEHVGEVLPVTDRKDFGMVALLDDRAVAIEKNTGKYLGGNVPSPKLCQAHGDPSTPGHPDYCGATQ